MILLAFDTATVACSAAVWRDGAVVADECAAADRGQAEALMPMVERVLAAAGAGYGDLDRLAVTVGPGAFTGLRIGLAAARGMALAAGLPVSGVTTLEAIAAGVDGAARAGADLLVVIDAKRADVYAQLFRGDAETGALAPRLPPRAVLPEALPGLLAPELAAERPLLLAGDGAERVSAALAGAGLRAETAAAPGWPEAARVAEIAAARADGSDELPLAPLYLRPPQAALPAHGGRLRP